VWLGRADPVETMETARADDPSRTSLRAIVSAWLNVVGDNDPMTAGDLKDTACSTKDRDLLLNKAISVVASTPGRSEIDAVRLGRWLGRNKNRIVDDIKIIGEKDPHSKQMLWRLEKR
jgi:putative DNA primase/helicase